MKLSSHPVELSVDAFNSSTFAPFIGFISVPPVTLIIKLLSGQDTQYSIYTGGVSTPVISGGLGGLSHSNFIVLLKVS